MARGFSYIEALLALALMVVVMGIAMTFFVNIGSTMRTESTALDAQQTGRLAIDEVVRSTRQAGLGVVRADPFNPATWQSSIVHASSHTLAFNADIDRTIGSLASSVTLGFPIGPSYVGEGPAASKSGAETYLFTLDANGDGTLDGDDRTQAESGNYNPAAENENPHDFGLFRRLWGYNGTDNGGALEPLAGSLFTNAASDAVYDDATSPAPLFAYWLTEDLSGDGLLHATECVNDTVDTCPPSTSREPVLYLWGDSDFDGRLSEAEKTALLGLEVGSAGWSKNPLVESGTYVTTTLATAIDPSADDPYTVRVVDADKFPPGTHVLIGSGGAAERRTVDQTVTSAPEMLLLSTPLANTHAAGTTVEALPSTLQRAIRSVSVTFSAMTAERDIDGATKAIGRAGRVGTGGLDYRVMSFQREVEVINAPAVALVKASIPGVVDVCPLAIVNACSATDFEQTARFTNLTGQNQFGFLVTDELGTPVAGIPVALQNAAPSLGGLAATELTSDASGLVSATYNMTGTLGQDEISATVTCIGDGGLLETASATSRVDLYSLASAVTQDCLGTVGPATPAPASPFKVTVTAQGGPVSGFDVDLSLDFDPAYLPPTPDFNSLVGSLDVGGSTVGTTDSTGVLGPVTFTTNGSGEVAGAAGLVSDTSRKGARLRVDAAVAPAGCTTVPDGLNRSVSFFDLKLESLTPTTGCTTASPCTISAGMPAPQVRATLEINDGPVAGAPLTFTATDVQVPSDAYETGASVLKPATGIMTDSNGQGGTRVSNNGASVITPITPLVTQVNVTSSGHPSWCSSGLITSSDLPLQFEFQAPAPQCDSHMQQSWQSKIDNKKICTHSRNDNQTGGCNKLVKGVAFKVYQADGVTPDASVKVKRIDGGPVTAAPTCSTTGMLKLFEDKCHAQDRVLNNGELWTFTVSNGCVIPMTAVPPQQFFTFSMIEFNGDYPKGRKMDVTLLWICSGPCDPGFLESETFTFTLPN